MHSQLEQHSYRSFLSLLLFPVRLRDRQRTETERGLGWPAPATTESPSWRFVKSNAVFPLVTAKVARCIRGCCRFSDFPFDWGLCERPTTLNLPRHIQPFVKSIVDFSLVTAGV